MGPSRKSSLNQAHVARIKTEIMHAAYDHLNAGDAEIALSHFTDDVIAVSNTQLFSSYAPLAEDVKAYNSILKEVNHAVWDETHIKIINKGTAIVTAKFHYSFTDTNDEKTDLQGVLTALYVRKDGGWKICVRHESFESM